MRLFFSSPFFPLLASGKDGEMKKLIDFEYDLWTTEDGRCMVRVRLTKEECEVDRETFRLLRAEEKRLRRERTPEKREGVAGEAAKRPLSLDVLDSDAEGIFWHTDLDNMEERIILDLTQKEFWDGLTSTQQKIYWLVVVNGLSYKRCADICGVTYQAVQKSLGKIRKKAKIFFV